MLSGVSPCAICHRISPLFRSIALMLPYGGLASGSPWTVSGGGPSPAGAAPPAAGVVACALGFLATPLMYVISERWPPGMSPMLPIWRREGMYAMCVSGSYDPPDHSEPPPPTAIARVPSGPSHLLTTGGVNTGPILYREASCTACARNSGVKSIRSSIDDPCRSYAGGLVGNGCVALVFSPGTVDCSTGRSTIGQMGWPLTRLNT